MKQSIRTAKSIYEEMFKLKQDLQELDKAVSVVSDSIGKGIPYRLLKQQYDEKKKELEIFEGLQYVTAATTTQTTRINTKLTL